MLESEVGVVENKKLLDLLALLVLEQKLMRRSIPSKENSKILFDNLFFLKSKKRFRLLFKYYSNNNSPRYRGIIID